MTSRNQKSLTALVSFFIVTLIVQTAHAEMRFVQIEAKDKFSRSAIADLGVAIEGVRSDSVWALVDEPTLERLKKSSHRLMGDFNAEVSLAGFPPQDSRYHTYVQNSAALKDLQGRNADITRVVSIGKSLEGRDIWAIHINTNPDALRDSASQKPGAVFMGNHHAREHLSVEVPLMLAQYLLNHREDAQVATMLDTRDIWIIPMINPDGAEYDISGGKYKYWRKNRRDNKDGTFGVDLNRNYGFKWGTGGSSNDGSSDVFMGPAPFSEPETAAVRDFVSGHTNLKMLLTFHSFSELVLYPWGHTYDSIGNAKDFAVFKKMADTMAGWNHYTPEQSSGLYIASGDTTDWAYGERGIFAFTFELSPQNQFSGGGFYPGAAMIDKAFNDNLKPCLYMLDLADDPYRATGTVPSGGLKNYVAPGLIPGSVLQ